MVTAILQSTFGAEYKLGRFASKDEANAKIAETLAEIERTGKFRNAVAFTRHFRGVVR